MSIVAKVGATVLDQSFGRSWRDELTGAGSFRLSFQNDDPDIPSYGDVVSFEVNGVERYAGVVGADNIVTHSQGEAHDQITTVTGLGRLGETRRGVVRPARGVGSRPTERSRSQFWGAWDYDDSDWPDSKRIRRADSPTIFSPYRRIPEWWPAKLAWWVWADQADVDEEDAPLGACLIRHHFTLDDSGPIEIHIAANNRANSVYYNGHRVGDIANNPNEGMRVRVDDVTAGPQVVAASITNFIRDGGYISAVWTLDDDGLLDELVSVSDYTNTLCLKYPDEIPTITQGAAIIPILEQMQAEGELAGVTWDFDELVDSAGEPWDGVIEVSTQIGAKGLDYLLAMADWAIDVHMTPDGVLQAWNWGTRGSVTSVEVVATTDPNTSEVEELNHNGRDIRANRLLVAYRRGLLEVEDAAGVLADGPIPEFVDLGDLETSQAATAQALALLELRKDPSYASTLTLAPVSSMPYEDFDVGDYIEHPDEAGGTKTSRVLSIAVTEDDEGNLTYVLELNEIRREIEERHDNTLKRFAMGSLAGGSQLVSKSGESLPTLTRVSDKTVAEFSFQDPVDGAITAKDPAKSSGNLIEFYVEVTTEDGSPTSSDTEVQVWLNATSLGTLTVPAGDDAAEFDLAAQKVYRNVSRLRAEVVTVGGGVNGITVQVRAI